MALHEAVTRNRLNTYSALGLTLCKGPTASCSIVLYITLLYVKAIISLYACIYTCEHGATYYGPTWYSGHGR